MLRASYVIWESNPSGYRFAYPATKPNKLKALEPELRKIEGIRFSLPKSGENAVLVGIVEGSDYKGIIGKLKRIFNPLLPYGAMVLFVKMQRCGTGRHYRQIISGEFVPGFEPTERVKADLYAAVGKLDVEQLVPMNARTEQDLEAYKAAIRGLKQRNLTYIQNVDLDISFCCR